MSKVENLDQIIESYGPHLHDAPHGGWRADRVIDRVVPTHCPYCAVQCGMNLLVEQDHVVGVEPRYDFPVNEGRLCPKGVTAYLQVHHPDRLLYPLIKRNGRFERVSWDEALDLVVSKFKELQNTHGNDSIGIYSGSSLTTEKTYLMGKFARAGLGTRYVDYNGRLCMVSAAAACRLARCFARSRLLIAYHGETVKAEHRSVTALGNKGTKSTKGFPLIFVPFVLLCGSIQRTIRLLRERYEQASAPAEEKSADSCWDWNFEDRYKLG